MNNKTIRYFKITSLMMALGIAIGAFGAHGLSPFLDDYGTMIFNKGSSYWFYNTAGLFGVAIISYLFPNSTKIEKGFWFILLGTLIFSISLFTLALTHIKILGAITPIGGTSMIIGWILVFLGIRKDRL